MTKAQRLLLVFTTLGIDSLTELRAKGYAVFQHYGKNGYLEVLTYTQEFGQIEVRIGTTQHVNEIHFVDYNVTSFDTYTDAEVNQILREKKIKTIG